jgi:glycosyltransferase involved in cell wall biosynthesis
MSGKPQFTALIDTYNHERFIAEAIESVLAQDFPASEMEILVVDDGSTDSTPEIVRRYAERVRYIRKENGGQASALNLGFAEARGEIVAMLDGDDVWLPNKISRMASEFAKEPDAVVVCHPYITWLCDQNVEFADQTFHPVRGKMPLAQEDLLRYGDYGTCGMALRREAASPLFPLPEDLEIYADSYIVFLAIFVGKVVGINECLTKYRYHASNRASFREPDRAKAKRRWACYEKAIQEARKWLDGHNYDAGRPDLAAYLKRHELVTQMLRFYWDPPGRAEYFRYLRDSQKLYAPLWTLRYRAFRALLSLVGFVLGYHGLAHLQESYRRSRAPLRLRRGLFPAHGAEASLL